MYLVHLYGRETNTTGWIATFDGHKQTFEHYATKLQVTYATEETATTKRNKRAETTAVDQSRKGRRTKAVLVWEIW